MSRAAIAATCAACSASVLPPTAGRGLAFCGACQTPLLFGDLASPFDVLSEPLTAEPDAAALERKYYELSRRLHPDRAAAAGRASAAAVKARLELSAALNHAYQSLRTPERRLESLLHAVCPASDAEKKSAAKTQIPLELSEEFFELQEAVMEDAPDARGRAAALKEKIEALRETLTAALAAEARRIDWASRPPESELVKILELRRQRSYVRSMLENLEKLVAEAYHA